MVKSSREQIKKDEQKILEQLQQNSNESIEIIARNCGFSRQKVWRLIKRLEKNKTIWTYTAVVDDVRLNQKKFILLLRRTNQPVKKDQLESVISGKLKEEFKKIGIWIDCCFMTHGWYDFVILVTTEDVRRIKLLEESINKMFSENIAELMVLESVFPLQKSRCDNPNLENIVQYFLPDK